ncbi:MAG: tetracycline resistance MFS efflux pump [Acidobacteriota bacterium]
MREHRAKLGTLFLIVFTDLIGFGMIIPVLPLYAERYGPGAFELGLLLSSFSIMQFVFNPLLGRISDRFGRRPVLLVSLLGAAVGYAILAAADSMFWLFVARVVAGVFAANVSTAQAVIADITGPEDRAKGMGILGAAFGLGFIVGPGFGAVLDLVAPWLPGVAAATCSLTAFAMAWFLLPETLVKGGRPARRWLDLGALRETLARPAVLAVLAGVLLMITAFSMFEATFAQFLERFLGLVGTEHRARIYGFFVYAGLLAAIVQGTLVGRLSRRFGASRLVVAGGALAAAALLAIPWAGSTPALLAVLAVLALGQGLAGPSLSAVTSTLVEHDRVGGLMGLYQAMSSLGRIVGPIAGQAALGLGGAVAVYGIAAMLDVLMALLVAAALHARPAPARPLVE